METLGKKIKQVRKHNKLTQDEFAKSLGISQAHISKIEKSIEVPSKQLLTFIAYRYDVNIDWLENKSDEYNKRKENTGLEEREIAAIVIVYNDGGVKKVKRGMAVSLMEDKMTLDCLNMTQNDFLSIGNVMEEAAVEIVNIMKNEKQS